MRSSATPTEVNRLHGVMNARLVDRDYLARRYLRLPTSPAGDGRATGSAGARNIDDFPHSKAWHERASPRVPAVQRGRAVGEHLRDPNYQIGKDPVAAQILSASARRAEILTRVKGCASAQR